jgi:hypothetical protein
MFRKEIVNFLYQHLKRDKDGRYLIELGGDRCHFDVEDTAFVVSAVLQPTVADGVAGESLELLLSDGTAEQLDATTLRIGKDNIPYCSVKNHLFDARFSRVSYYQLAHFIRHDSERDAYYILLNGTSHYIRRIV